MNEESTGGFDLPVLFLLSKRGPFKWLRSEEKAPAFCKRLLLYESRYLISKVTLTCTRYEFSPAWTGTESARSNDIALPIGIGGGAKF
jgi:hypothetical protein